MSTTHQSADAPTFRILVPLDGTARAERALEFARQLPWQHLVLLHVEPDDLMLIPGWPKLDHEEQIGEIKVELEELAAPLRTRGREVEVVVRFGDVAENIIDAAEPCNLIVMATHGRNAAGRMLFGSVADRVSRYSTTPALMIRIGKEGEAIPSMNRIVVPLDGSETAERALPLATAIAEALPLPLRLVRAVGLDDVRGAIHDMRKSGIAGTAQDDTYDLARQKTEDHASQYLEGLAEQIRACGLVVETEILRGTASFELLRNLQADDLVVMTTHGRRGYRRWLLGSVAEKLVREAKAPILLVPTRDSDSPEKAP